ncbi:ACT domain-containing protein [Bariatricus sp. HCP28S3_C2]|uniref:ACT domain-containing protein n=1 Tax=unclassified Bariatricus TaxID=2677046 RepID=UPI003F88E1E3
MIAKVCTYLADTNINILDISQTIVDGYFNMMAVVDVENSKKELDIVSVDLRDLGLQIGVDIHCQREEIFQRMHRL